MNKPRSRLALALSLSCVGLLSATVIPTEELEANKPTLQPTQSGNTLTLNWATQPEVYYFVEGSSDLGAWITAKLLKDTLAEGILNLGTAISSDKAFFRLSLEGDPGASRLRADDDGDKIINVLEADANMDAFKTETSEDSDGDEIPDYWEQFHLGTIAHDANYIATPEGLTLAEAYAAATDPNSIDSDGDGWRDQQEIDWGWDPNYDQSRDDSAYAPEGDIDGDGRNNRTESLNNTSASDPTDAPPAPPRFAIIDLGEASNVVTIDLANNGRVLNELEPNHIYYTYQRWTWGVLQDLSPNMEGIYCSAINSSGVVVGQVEDLASYHWIYHAAYWPTNSPSYTILAPATPDDGSGVWQGIRDITDSNKIGGKGLIQLSGIANETGMTGQLATGYDFELGSLFLSGSSPDYKANGIKYYPYRINDRGSFVGSHQVYLNGYRIEYNRGVSVIAGQSLRLYEKVHYLNEQDMVLASLQPYPDNHGALILADGSSIDLGLEALETPVEMNSPSSPSEPLMILTTRRLMIQKSTVDSGGTVILAPIVDNTSFSSYDLSDVIDSEFYPTTPPASASYQHLSPDGSIMALQANHKGTGSPHSLLLLKMDIVPDYNRDGAIDLKDRNKITDTNPHRWWLNDDDDISEVKGKDAPGDGSADYSNSAVDTARDLVDFFPVFIDLKSFLTGINDLSTITVKLKHADGSLKFVYTDLLPENSREYWYETGLTTGYGSSFTSAPGVADTIAITSSGVALSQAFLTKMKDEDKGVIMLEGAGNSSSTEPLVLEVSNSSGKLFDYEMPLELSPVTDMFRNVNLASRVGTTETYSDSTSEPSNYPDTLTNDKHFAFIHGYNVSQDASKAWNCEIFKRMHQTGSRAKFVGLTWDGDTSPDYHNAVYRAFRTSEHVAAELSSFSNLTIAAHSLGNMVISNAMENHGFSPARYYLMNAATPIEAYNATQTSNSSGNVDMDAYMTEVDWKDFPDRLYAANWYQLFDSEDARSTLTWKNRFESIRNRSYNFYSPGEDVVENGKGDESVTSILLDILKGWRTGESIGTHAWVTQEIAKGGKNIMTAAMLAELHGGWDFNGNQNDLEQVGILKSIPAETDSYRPRFAHETSATVPSNEQLAQFGFFSLLDEYNNEKLYAPIDDANVLPRVTQTQTGASALAAQDDVQWHLLAEAIPAMSFAAAANHVEGMQGNYDMMNDANGWPADRLNSVITNRWLHSDFKNVSLNYVRKTYEQMISIGGLDDE